MHDGAQHAQCCFLLASNDRIHCAPQAAVLVEDTVDRRLHPAGSVGVSLQVRRHHIEQPLGGFASQLGLQRTTTVSRQLRTDSWVLVG